MASSTWQKFRFPGTTHIGIVLATLGSLLAAAAPCSAQLFSTPSAGNPNPGATTTFMITAPANDTLKSVSVLTLGAPNLDYTLVSSGTTCPTLTAGACSIAVLFQPTRAGRRQGAVVVTDTAGNSLSISLVGVAPAAVAGFAPSTISTFAGRGSGGDGGPATSAQLASATGFARDGFGNTYIVDQKGNKVRKVSASGVISTFAGTGNPGYSGDGAPATSAQLNSPWDVVVDGAGFVFISDTNNNVVRMVDPSGIISTYAGQFYAPGTTPPPVCAGATNTVGDGCPGNKMVLSSPMGLVFCKIQNLHIADKLHNQVRTIARVGYNTFTQVGNGVAGYNGDGENNTDAELNGPTGLDMDGPNFIYVADTGNHIIRKTLLTGTTPNPIATVAGIPSSAGSSGDGGRATSAMLDTPVGIHVDPAGDVYISDNTRNVIRKVNISTGSIATIVGTGAAGFSGDTGFATSAQLNGPSNIFVDENETLYIADTQNAAIRRINLAAAPSLTFAPTGIGGTSVAVDVAVTNLGNASLKMTGITTTGNYALTGPNNSCNASLQNLDSGQSCILGIQFTPKASGALTGTIVLADNAQSPTQTIALTGNGTTSATYTITTQAPTVSISGGLTGSETLSLTSNSYSGTISFATTITLADGSATSDLTASISPVNVTAGATVNSTVTIMANIHAANQNPPRSPVNPWNKTSAPLFGVVLIGLPLAFWRKQSRSLILMAAAISFAGLLTACSGATGSSNSTTPAAKSYVVTVTPTASPMGSVAVTNPAPAKFSVTIQ
jgi:hypothetical protein